MDKATYAILNNKINNLAQDIDQIATEATEAWLDEHVDPDTGYVIDNSLTVTGAAADAKATGDALTAQSAKIDDVVDLVIEYDQEDKSTTGVTSQVGYIKDNGDIAASSGYETLTFPITEDCYVYAEIEVSYQRMGVYSSSSLSSSTIKEFYAPNASPIPPLPTIQDPLFVHAGDYVALSHRPKGDETKYCRLYVSNTIEYTLKSTTALTDTMKSEISAIRRPIYNFDWINSVIGVCHMGYHVVAPENTLPAIRLAKRNGFRFFECDVHFTSDHIPILMHDTTINRTCCNASDGSTIVEDVSVDNSTYNDLLAYDACSPEKWSVYQGTKIPTFEQVLELCRELDLYIDIDCKDLNVASDIQILINLCKQYDMLYNVIFSFNSATFVETAVTCDDTIYLAAYGTSVADSYITRLSACLTGNNKVAYVVKSASTADVTACINAGLDVGIYVTAQDDDVESALDNADKRIKFFTANVIDATQYLYNHNIGDSNTGLITD